MRAWLAVCAVLVASPVRGAETVRIAIVDGTRQITLAGPGLEVRKLEAGERYAAAPGGRSVVHLSGGRLHVDGAPVDAPDGVKYRSQGIVKVADEPVRGEIEIRLNGDDLVAINVVPLEDYLLAVLGSEMPPSFPIEALKAQAVAARTYALRRKIEAWGKPYHLGNTVLHQVYGGVKVEDARTRDAVRATQGEVLTWGMEPVEAYFHASCGGRTESGLEALGRDVAYLKSVPCACEGQPNAVWSQRLDPKEFQALVKGELRDLAVVERTPSGRARRIELRTSSARRVVTGVELRRALGYDRVKSLDFRVERKGSSVVFTGRGYGHGAGMCQWGAKAYAERGWTYQRILAHFYVGSDLRKMY